MYKITDIKQLHIELTQRCQAACPQCDRNIDGGAINPHLTNAELSLEDITKILPPDFVKQLTSIQLCGNHGDPIIATETLAIVTYFRQHNPAVFITMNTNGGARAKAWWTSLASILGKRGKVIFSIDGLADTNHVYRQNVEWGLIERSVTAFTTAGGEAHWHFLIFKHNQHQIEEARNQSKIWNMKEFVAKKSSSFISGRTSDQLDVFLFSTKTNLLQMIEKPTRSLQNKLLVQQDSVIMQHGSMDNYYDTAEIQCKVKATGGMYISAEGLAFPCCWTASRLYKWWRKDIKEEQIWSHVDAAGGKDAINLKIVGLDGALNSGLFTSVETSWGLPTVDSGKLKICCMKCTPQFDVVKGQYE